MAFHVFVEGPVDPSPNATMQLAAAMAKRYGLPETELSSRLARGRFRVKANIDRATADTYARDLVALGARVTIADAETGAAIPSPDDAAPAAEIGGSASGSYRSARPSSDPIPSTRLRAVGAARPSTVPTSARVATPPVGVRTATPPAGVRTATPPVGVARPTLDAAERTGLDAASPTRTPATGIRATGLDAAAPSPSRTATPPSGLAAARTATPPSGLAAARTATPPSGLAAVPPARPSAPPSALAAAGEASRPSNPQVSSGLAAAYGDSSEQLDFGALGDDRAFSLSSVDGADDAPASANELFAPAPALADDDPAFPASIGPSVTPAPKPKAEPKGPVDLFAPPEAADDKRDDFAIDDDVHRDREPAPPDTVASATTTGPITTPTLSARIPVVAAEPAKPARPPGPMSRNRFFAGLALAIILGFIPAHLVASSKESALAAIDDEVVKFQQNRDNTEADVDAFRAGRLADKQSKKQSIALTGMLIWIVAGAALGFAWTRMPFNRDA